MIDTNFLSQRYPNSSHNQRNHM